MKNKRTARKRVEDSRRRTKDKKNRRGVTAAYLVVSIKDKKWEKNHRDKIKKLESIE